MPERELGTIVRLQIQRDPLKVKGVSYDPAGILAVEEASLDSNGVLGRHRDAWVLMHITAGIREPEGEDTGRCRSDSQVTTTPWRSGLGA